MSVYSVLLALSMVLFCDLWTREAQRRGWILNRWKSPAPIFVLACLIGAKLLAVVGEWDRYREFLLSWEGPLAIQGAIVAAAALSAIYGKLRRIPILELLDTLGWLFPFSFIVIRTGCLLQGCCFGKPTEIGWGIPDSKGNPLHPTQVYEIALCAGLGIVLTRIRKHKPRPGAVFSWFCLGYGSGRAIIEFFRNDTVPILQDLTYPQIVGVLMCVAGLWIQRQLQSSTTPAPKVSIGRA